MHHHHIRHLDDPRLEPYQSLKDRELAREGDRFVAQGEQVVRRLLASPFPVESILLTESRLSRLSDAVPAHVPVLLLPDELMAEVVGFPFHAGALAVGRRMAPPTLDALCGESVKRRTLLVIPEVINHENLGSMLRIAAAFGIDGVILGERCLDAFWRRSIRVSMGATFHVPIRHTADLAADMRALRDTRGFELAGAVVADSAESLAAAPRGDRLAVVMGHEWHGIAEPWRSLCGRQVTIHMAEGVDSLNVAMATAVMLYHFTQAV